MSTATAWLRALVLAQMIVQLIAPGELFAGEPTLHVHVDARQLPRKLLRSVIQFEAQGDTVAMRYPEWIPGIHAPRGPVANLGGFIPRDAAGNVLRWERDWSDVYRLLVLREGSDSSEKLSVELTYIANQPSVNSVGVDVFGAPTLGIINWNTVLLKPEGISAAALRVELELTLPPDWQAGSALTVASRHGNRLRFEPVSYEQLIDRPLICGLHYRQVELARTKGAVYLLDIVADEARDLPQQDSVLAPLGALALEGEALFGPAPHFAAYHFLLAVSDHVPRIGLEHRESSLNSARANAFRELDWIDNGIGYLLPHEFVHAWVGKYRRPVGMATGDFHTAKNTEDLWIYEGLTQYLGNVLAVRSGLVTFDEFRQTLVRYTGQRLREKGRQWRPLRDTAVAGYTLRGGSASWGLLRRGQSYYVEGALTWLDFDARLRERSAGLHSLDEFCRAFFGGGDQGRTMLSFTAEDVLAGLEELDGNVDWADLVESRVERTQREFTPEWVASAGYRLKLVDEVPALLKKREKRGKYIYLGESLGLTVMNLGRISSVTPGGVADAAGVYPGIEIIGVNGFKFSPERLRSAVEDSPETGHVELLTLDGERFATFDLPYDGGRQFWAAELREDRIDRLADIAAERRSYVQPNAEPDPEN
jgi:predicted metalloprotease with PDZ domain